MPEWFQEVLCPERCFAVLEGKPLVLQVVHRAEELLIADKSRNHEYLGITGLPQFNKLSAQLILGADSPAIQERRITTVQCLSGTGSLRVGAEFLGIHYRQPGTEHAQHTNGMGWRNCVVYVPNPTWGNHNKIFPKGGVPVKSYRYYHPGTRGLDFDGTLKFVGHLPCHLCRLRNMSTHAQDLLSPSLCVCVCVNANVQGFATGSLDSDAEAVRSFVSDGGEALIAQSYAKNLGLYGERVGALSMVCASERVAALVESQLKLVIRPMYSNPPAHGALIVAKVLSDRELFESWKRELKGMADRIISMRHQLFDALQQRRTPGDWSHILKQIGMFTFTGLNKDQVAFMTKEFHIYMTSDGRISMAGLSSRTVPHLADAIHAAVTCGSR
eukprot:jgi/Mesen1/4770/ME000242S03944